MGRKEQRIKNKLEKNPIKECLSIKKMACYSWWNRARWRSSKEMCSDRKLGDLNYI